MTEIDSKYMLGKICKRGHEHDNTGKTIRYKSAPSNCVVCKREQSTRYNASGMRKINAERNGFGTIANYQNQRLYTRGVAKPLAENPKCSSFLGVHIAENVLSRVFNGVSRTPLNTPGYDFICANGYKIDAKSGCLSDSRNAWGFGITRNNVADYFILMAFDDRTSLTPQHIWLIGAHESVRGRQLCEYAGIWIKNTPFGIQEFEKFERLDKLHDAVSMCTKARNTVDMVVD